MCYYNNAKRTTHNNKREKAFSCFCNWKDIDEDYFEFTVIGVCACDMDELEDVLAEYV